MYAEYVFVYASSSLLFITFPSSLREEREVLAHQDGNLLPFDPKVLEWQVKLRYLPEARSFVRPPLPPQILHGTTNLFKDTQ